MNKQFPTFLLLFVLVALCADINLAQQQTNSKNLLLIRVDEKAGFIDGTGKLVITPQFEDAGDFSEDFAAAKINGKWGFINTTGSYVIEAAFDFVVSDFVNGLAIVVVNKKCGAIDKSGKFVIEPKYESMRTPSEGLIPAQLSSEDKYSERWIYINYQGEKVIDSEFRHANSFTDGRAFVSVGFDEWALIDRSGNEVTKKHFDSNDPFGPFVSDLAAVKIKKKWGYINRAGKLVIKPQFDDASNFSEGLAPVQIGCNYGYINEKGKLVIPADFGIADKFSDGVAAVSIGKRSEYRNLKGGISLCGRGGFVPQGYIDRFGKIVIRADFENAFSFSDGIAQVSFGEPPDMLGVIGERGYIDKTGKYIWKPTK